MFPYFLTLLLFSMSWISRRVFYPTSKRYMKLPETINAFGTAFQAAYITLLLTTIEPFRCYPHPNGLKSVAKFPDIICGEASHSGMATIAIFAILPLICFILFYVYQVYTIPTLSLNDPEFFRPIKFILARFHAGAWYWGVIFLVRNFFVTIGTLIDPGHPFKQTIFGICVLMAYNFFQVAVWPWRSRAINILDSLQTTCVTVMLSSALPLIGKSDTQTRTQAGFLIMFAFLLSFVSLFGYIMWILFDWFVTRRSPTYAINAELRKYKKAESLYIRLLHLSEKILTEVKEHDVREFVYNITDIDFSRMERMMHMLCVELIPHHGSFVHQQHGGQSYMNRRARANLVLSVESRKTRVSKESDSGLAKALGLLEELEPDHNFKQHYSSPNPSSKITGSAFNLFDTSSTSSMMNNVNSGTRNTPNPMRKTMAGAFQGKVLAGGKISPTKVGAAPAYFDISGSGDNNISSANSTNSSTGNSNKNLLKKHQKNNNYNLPENVEMTNRQDPVTYQNTTGSVEWSPDDVDKRDSFTVRQRPSAAGNTPNSKKSGKMKRPSEPAERLSEGDEIRPDTPTVDFVRKVHSTLSEIWTGHKTV